MVDWQNLKTSVPLQLQDGSPHLTGRVSDMAVMILAKNQAGWCFQDEMKGDEKRKMSMEWKQKVDIVILYMRMWAWHRLSLWSCLQLINLGTCI